MRVKLFFTICFIVIILQAGVTANEEKSYAPASGSAFGFTLPVIGMQHFFTQATGTSPSGHLILPALGVDFVSGMGKYAESQVRFLWGTPTMTLNKKMQSIYFSWTPNIYLIPKEKTSKFNLYFQIGISMLLRIDPVLELSGKALNGFMVWSPVDFHVGPVAGLGFEVQVHPIIWIKGEVRGDLFITFVTDPPFAGGYGLFVGPTFRF